MICNTLAKGAAFSGLTQWTNAPLSSNTVMAVVTDSNRIPSSDSPAGETLCIPARFAAFVYSVYNFSNRIFT